ncbi:hypothetical protein ED312_19735 [Sinomicrobium pectinilyticum]|uniref:Uncharacterized protein n=1 Tax=Sinomicrobium pectinilyticum TaxID=1084421 RepID=A0A3N0DR40_SINP1|nr:hypothetical protein [Sinomicrobium pectinilyticum]RNL78099.1 hypothetical protein ED312_19735 [Sinomicrobium pectinilyticum]
MRISLRETKQLEDRIFGREDEAEALVMNVKLHLDKELGDKLVAQQLVYDCVRAYGRKNLKAEIASADHKLFSEKKYEGFRERVRKLFGTCK